MDFSVFTAVESIIHAFQPPRPCPRSAWGQVVCALPTDHCGPRGRKSPAGGRSVMRRGCYDAWMPRRRELPSRQALSPPPASMPLQLRERNLHVTRCPGQDRPPLFLGCPNPEKWSSFVSHPEAPRQLRYGMWEQQRATNSPRHRGYPRQTTALGNEQSCSLEMRPSPRTGFLGRSGVRNTTQRAILNRGSSSKSRACRWVSALPASTTTSACV